MKRIVAILLGALIGAIGLPRVMWACGQLAHVLLPFFVAAPPTGRGLLFLALPIHGRTILVISAMLGFWSVILWRGGRSFWPRFGSAMGAAATFGFFALILKATYPTSRMAFADLFWARFALFAPPMLWSLALFLFAVSTRRRTSAR